MFSTQERDTIRQRLLDLAAADPAIAGAAVTGSQATGDEDRWSDIDLVFGVDGPPAVSMRHWTDRLYDDFGAAHHWDLPSGSAVYRVFLLPGCLEADIAFVPIADFAPRGPSWRTVFGSPAESQPAPAPTADHLAGLAWHHALHARISIERNRLWQAEHWISAVRTQVIALACLRLGHPTSYAKGAHLLPADLTSMLAATLVRTLDGAELRRALGAAVDALIAELDRTDPALAARLLPALTDLASPTLLS
ncbi:nucleotidyltransferase domain-containing protein [Hamadaea sp. NPDC051192]|uniref:nucleotidyltransferase domain-containing protein n=1 Tax=Hamadaea sp. NPDC051192 TaxID=3154940 RepID=UPI0034396AA0